jgi:hypothetical protein
MNNWNGVMIVVSSLANTSVARLSDTWAQLGKEESKAHAEELEPLTRKNFKMLRQVRILWLFKWFSFLIAKAYLDDESV